MPRRADMPCATCGDLMWRGKGTLPAGQARCRPCRKNDPKPHGATGYKRGCRCSVCREGKRLEMVAYVEMVRQRDGITPTQKIRPTKNRRPPGPCLNCGKMLRQAGPSALCTPCRRRLKRGIDISAADRLAIYERDGWICGFCSESVDPTIKNPKPWAATLDHIIPRSKGGSDDADNLRLAHRYCNNVRSNKDALTLDDLAA